MFLEIEKCFSKNIFEKFKIIFSKNVFLKKIPVIASVPKNPKNFKKLSGKSFRKKRGDPEKIGNFYFLKKIFEKIKNL